MRGGIMWRLLLGRFLKDECDETKGMLSAYIDQYLSLKEQKEVEQHLKACQRCQEELDSIRATVELLHRVPQILPYRSFAIAEAKPVPRRTAVWALRAATSVAALCLVLLFAGDLVNLFEGTPSLMEKEGAPPSTLGPERDGHWGTVLSPDEWYGPAEEELAAEEAGWLRPLEYSLVGVVAILGGVTIANWRKERKRSKIVA